MSPDRYTVTKSGANHHSHNRVLRGMRFKHAHHARLTPIAKAGMMMRKKNKSQAAAAERDERASQVLRQDNTCRHRPYEAVGIRLSPRTETSATPVRSKPTTASVTS
jgi:hypothetical protein